MILDLKLPIAAKKEISGQIYYLKLLGLNSELWIKSCDNPDSLVGEGLDWMIIDEAARVKQIVWEQYLRPTLSDRGGWCLFTTTPLGYNWIYDLYVRGQQKEYKDWDSWQHPSWESPYFKETIDELKKTLTKETLAQEFGAEFTSFAGKVYDFDRRVHIGNYKYNPDLPTYCSIDFGFRMPCVNWFQIETTDNEDELDTIYVIDEICHEENIKTEDLAKMILNKPYDVRRYFCDPAGGVQAQSGIGDIEILEDMVLMFNTKEIEFLVTSQMVLLMLEVGLKMPMGILISFMMRVVNLVLKVLRIIDTQKRNQIND